ncbi:hypothetical protein Q1695_012123 [Nippostrongylus brasiliensis]|nr:hypothetical protein Q1695_012123 [Nippostrongylus brasiliensis]
MQCHMLCTAGSATQSRAATISENEPGFLVVCAEEFLMENQKLRVRPSLDAGAPLRSNVSQAIIEVD